MGPGAMWGVKGLPQGPNSCADLIVASATGRLPRERLGT